MKSTCTELEELAVDFALHLRAANRAQKTNETYQEAISQFCAYLARLGSNGPPTIWELQRTHVAGFIESLQQRGLAEATVNNRYRSLSAFFHFVVDELDGVSGDRVFLHPMRKMAMPKVHDAPVPLIPRPAMQALLGTCRTTGFRDLRDKAIIMTFYNTGVRHAELLSMTTDNVWLSSESPSALVLRKGGDRELVPIEAARAAVVKYRRAREFHRHADLSALWLGTKGPLTQAGVREMLKKRGAQVGLVGLHAHQIRHTWVHEMKKAGCSDSDLMGLAGWRSRDMLTRYASAAAAERAMDVGRQINVGSWLASTK